MASRFAWEYTHGQLNEHFENCIGQIAENYIFQAGSLSHCPTHRKVTFAVSPTLIRGNTNINNLLEDTDNSNIPKNTSIVVCQNSSDSQDSCITSEKSKSRHKSQINRIRTEKEEDDRGLLFRDKQDEESLKWVEIDDSGRGSCSDESQVLSLDTVASFGRQSQNTGEEEDSAYCYAYSSPTQPKPSCPNPNQIPPSSNLQHVSPWEAEELGNIYEEIRPLKKTSTRSDQVTKERSGGEESDGNPLVLNISPSRPNRQQFYRLVFSCFRRLCHPTNCAVVCNGHSVL